MRLTGLNELDITANVRTGVDITAYGADLPGGLTLGKLVAKVLALVPLAGEVVRVQDPSEG